MKIASCYYKVQYNPIVLFIILFFACSNAVAQKLVFDYESIKSWQTLGQYDISNNGRYIWYENLSAVGDSLIILSRDGTSRRAFDDSRGAVFSIDSRCVIFRHAKSVSVFDLERNKLHGYQNAKSFICSPQKKWAAIFFDTCIIVKNLINYKEQIFKKVSRFQFDINDDACWGQINDSLFYFNLKNESKTFCSYEVIQSDISFSEKGDLVAFNSKLADSNIVSIYKKVNGRIEKCGIIKIANFANGYYISDEKPWFGNDDNFLFLKLRRRKNEIINQKIFTDRLNIWHYKDRWLQSQQLLHLNEETSQSYIGVWLRKEKRFIQLEHLDSTLVNYPRGNYVVKRRITNEDDAYWNNEETSYCRLFDISRNKEIRFMPDSSRYGYWDMSRSEKYVLYMDTITQHIYCYEINSKNTIDLTEGISSRRDFRDMGLRRPIQFDFGGWTKDENAVIIYDRYDLWLVDPKGNNKAVCLTDGWGTEQKVVLRLACKLENFSLNDSILISGLKESNKWNGIFKAKLSWNKSKLNGELGPYVYYFPALYFGSPMPPIKGGNSNIFLLQKQSDTLASNLFLTQDFHFFKQLSFFSPQKTYNWVTSKLIQWTALDGSNRMGILYKPENFDSTKKYPIIFNYYELRSNECFKFLRPGLSVGGLNIPWYVSRGYLVFVPDIWGHSIYRGESALSSIVSAANYLTAKYNWIDAKKMALQGHSFGGFETNYIVSHSDLFAAAQASAGPSDFISGFGAIGFGGRSLANLHEEGQLNLRATPWDRPDIYVETSPLFNVKKISTPLLLMHNTQDFSVPIAQSIELYMAMRRLKKRVWLLEYDQEEHTLSNIDNMLDFTIRQQQFFDYYLKQSFPPYWMTTGVPANVKGYISGLDLDSSKAQP